MGTLGYAEGLRHVSGGHGSARPENRDTLLVVAGARARVQDGEPGRPDHGTSPLHPRAAYSHGPEVPEPTVGPLRHGCLQHGRTFPGGRGNPLGT